jgi:hypothetical protein
MARALPSLADTATPVSIPSGSSRPGQSFEDLVERIRAEFIEQPGLKLTEAQGCRLWQIDRLMLQRVLAVLVDTAFLSPTVDGRYARRSLV